MTLQVNDMVVLVRWDYGGPGDNEAYQVGLRLGNVGTVIRLDCCGYRHLRETPYCRVEFINLPHLWACVPQDYLRKINPPEAADQDFDWQEFCRPKELV